EAVAEGVLERAADILRVGDVRLRQDRAPGAGVEVGAGRREAEAATFRIEELATVGPVVIPLRVVTHAELRAGNGAVHVERGGVVRAAGCGRWRPGKTRRRVLGGHGAAHVNGGLRGRTIGGRHSGRRRKSGRARRRTITRRGGPGTGKASGRGRLRAGGWGKQYTTEDANSR